MVDFVHRLKYGDTCMLICCFRLFVLCLLVNKTVTVKSRFTTRFCKVRNPCVDSHFASCFDFEGKKTKRLKSGLSATNSIVLSIDGRETPSGKFLRIKLFL